jgi:glycosyltransferase involved in cell wall biosynthesis
MAAREKTDKTVAPCPPVVTATGVDLAKSSHCKYLLISPCRDEAKYMRETLGSVISQSIQPTKWVIVDDGSTDNTPQILAEYRAKHDWIEVVTRSTRGRRAVGSGVIDAFYAGYEIINPDDYDYLCKLDLDLRLLPRYFEILMERMAANPRIATCSGKCYLEQENGSLVYERHADDVSIGASKFYRVSCFKAIGGFVRELMWDGIDCHRCRMNGWTACSWDEPELRFIHLRPEGSSQKAFMKAACAHLTLVPIPFPIANPIVDRSLWVALPQPPKYRAHVATCVQE